MIITPKAFLTTNYHTLVLIQTVPRKKFMSYVKHFAKTPMVKLFLHHLNCTICFLQNIVCQLFWSPLLCTNLLVLDVNPLTLGKPNSICPQGWSKICKLIQNLTFFNTWMTTADDSCFIIIDHTSSSFRLKLKEALLF